MGQPALIAGAVLTDQERRQVRPFRTGSSRCGSRSCSRGPQPTLRRVLDFVGEPWSPEVLDHPAHAPDDLAPLPWFRNAGERVRSGFGPVAGPSGRASAGAGLNRRALAEQGLGPLPLAEEPARRTVARRYLGHRRSRSAARCWPRGCWRPRFAGTTTRRPLCWRLNPQRVGRLGPDFAMPPPPLPDGWSGAGAVLSDSPAALAVGLGRGAGLAPVGEGRGGWAWPLAGSGERRRGVAPTTSSGHVPPGRSARSPA